MQPHSSPMTTRHLRCCALAATLVCSLSLFGAVTPASPGDEGEFTAVPERAQVVSGEPVLLRISISNLSSRRLLIAMDPSWMERVTRGADGRTVRWPTQPAPQNPLVFSVAIEPHQSRGIKIAAVETAQLREPGPYTTSARIVALQQAVSVQFVVLPYDAPALKMRAGQFADQAVRQNDLEAEKALEAMPADLAEPYVCSVLKANEVALSTGVPWLEKMRTSESISCLVDLLPAYTGPYRLLLVNALRKAEKTGNVALRMKIDAALNTEK